MKSKYLSIFLLIKVLFLCFYLIYIGESRVELNLPTNDIRDIAEGICTPQKDFNIAYEKERGANIKSRDAWILQGNSIISLNICKPGKLSVDALGVVGGGEYPRMQILLDQMVLYDRQIEGSKKISINIPNSGHLMIAYLNDFYLADVRIAKLSLFRGSIMNCNQPIGVKLPMDSGATWSPDEKVVTVVRKRVLMDMPCNSGTLEVDLEGRLGNSHYPLLQFWDNEKLVLSKNTSSKTIKVSLKLTSRHLGLEIENPYAKTKQDRNLILYDLKFIGNLK